MICLSFRAAKINEKSIKNRIQNAIQDGKAQFLFHFGRKSSLRRLPDAPRRPKMPQETPQDGPRRPQDAPKRPPRRPRCPAGTRYAASQDAPRCPKMPKMAQGASKTPQEASRPRFSKDFWNVLERFWEDF